MRFKTNILQKRGGKGPRMWRGGVAHVSVRKFFFKKRRLRGRRELSFASESCRTMLEAGRRQWRSGSLLCARRQPACQSVCLFKGSFTQRLRQSMSSHIHAYMNVCMYVCVCIYRYRYRYIERDMYVYYMCVFLFYLLSFPLHHVTPCVPLHAYICKITLII